MKTNLEKVLIFLALSSAATCACADVPCAGNDISTSAAAFIGVSSPLAAGQGLNLAVGVHLTAPLEATTTRTANTIKITLVGVPEEGIPPPVRCVRAALQTLPAGRYTVDLYTLRDPGSPPPEPERFITSATLDVPVDQAPVPALKPIALLFLGLAFAFAAWIGLRKQNTVSAKTGLK